MEPSTSNLFSLLPSWKLAMQAAHKSPATIDSYMRGVRLFREWCENNGHTPELDKTLLSMWVAELLANGAEPNTARVRLQAVRQFSAWLADPEQGAELDSDPLLGIRPPKLDTKVIDGLTADEIRLLLKACGGKDFLGRRDEAVVRLLAETGLRAGECLGLTTADVNLERGLVTVHRGKGGKGRVVTIGPQTAAALDRYLRARRTHRLAHTAPLFLGGGDQGLGYHGLRVALLARAKQAGIEGFHLHRMRHSWASRWLESGGSEGGLMSAAGWSTREMVDRYARHTAAERAQAEARKLQLGDL
ncbi:tyrosine recombinase XerD [Mycobacterium mantenii]|uniref:Integrase n=1 Tax=Mycobacterium mantenii TaxID=560555 RepID=A0A1X0FXX2_MYCNT|nr:tyrosine-type recombinase/integrase [Mycobacterium mantenii]MCV7242797.1 tyrosine-type recombinase/integrase [Mycobacterium mantenii]ORB06369.1 integrase [Mycobacterium mantenii]BBY36504.1 tyrosine recombinase XerD [Mycobacterium mantenii]